MKMKLDQWLPAIVAGFVGMGIGACLALWGKLPTHTIDVFAFVESALGIVITALALTVTLGVLRLKAELEIMLATKRDEMLAEITNRFESGPFAVWRTQYSNDHMHIKTVVMSLENAWNVHWTNPKNKKP